MEASLLMSPEFWDGDAPVMMGGGPAADVPGLIFFRTSGSTGTPKWIGLSRSALLHSAAAVNRHLGVSSSDCWALALPIEHVGGFGVVARSYESGCRLVQFREKWNATSFVAWLTSSGATHLSLVPTQIHDLVAVGLAPPPSLRAVVVGGGMLQEADGSAARRLGWPVLASYGMTETASQIATQGLELLNQPYHPLPIPILPCWEVMTDKDDRILVKGNALFSGILKPHESGWKYEERRSEWHITSDTGSLDGRDLHLSGRADTRVKILGELVDPVAVEQEILSLSPGFGLAVIAVADPRAENRLVLFSEGDEGVTFDLVARYHASCPGFRRISETVAVRSIPRSPLGKPKRGELAQFFSRGQI